MFWYRMVAFKTKTGHITTACQQRPAISPLSIFYDMSNNIDDGNTRPSESSEWWWIRAWSSVGRYLHLGERHSDGEKWDCGEGLGETSAVAAAAVFKWMAWWSVGGGAEERNARLAGNHRRCAFKLQSPDREIARDIASIDDFPHAQPSPSPIV